LLAGVGGVLAVLFAWWGSRLLVVIASGPGTPVSIDVTPDARILAFTATLSLASVIIFGLVPALRTSRVGVGTSFNLNAGAPVHARLSQSLVVAQVALALVLLTAAGLFLQTLQNLHTRDLGFAADSLLEIRVHLGGGSHEQVDLSRRLLDCLAVTPGVQSASVAHAGFGTGISRTCCLAVEGYPHDLNEDREIRTLGVAPGYFRTMRLPLVRGRDFTQAESSHDPQPLPSVAIVNEAFVRRYLPRDRDPLGARFGWGSPPNVTYAFDVIGVAADAIYDDLREDSRPLIYFPFLWGDTFVVRAASQPEVIMATVRREIRRIDPTLEVAMRTVAEVLEREVIREKLLSQLSTFFGILGALLAAVGLYGTMAFAVSRRTREIGIRMALGAARGPVLRSELRWALRLVCYGIGTGAAAAVAAGRLIENQLYGVSATDPVTLTLIAVLLIFVAGVAAYVPARRAAGVDPAVALRCE
jgi:predicted permease